MHKYSEYQSINSLLERIKEQHNDNACNTNIANIKQLIITILQNLNTIDLSCGQIKLVFCFINKVKPFITNPDECIKLLLTELLCDYSKDQLYIIDGLLSCSSINLNNLNHRNNCCNSSTFKIYEILNIAYNPAQNTNEILSTQEEENILLHGFCNFFENLKNNNHNSEPNNNDIMNIIILVINLLFESVL